MHFCKGEICWDPCRCSPEPSVSLLWLLFTLSLFLCLKNVLLDGYWCVVPPPPYFLCLGFLKNLESVGADFYWILGHLWPIIHQIFFSTSPPTPWVHSLMWMTLLTLSYTQCCSAHFVFLCLSLCPVRAVSSLSLTFFVLSCLLLV